MAAADGWLDASNRVIPGRRRYDELRVDVPPRVEDDQTTDHAWRRLCAAHGIELLRRFRWGRLREEEMRKRLLLGLLDQRMHGGRRFRCRCHGIGLPARRDDDGREQDCDGKSGSHACLQPDDRITWRYHLGHEA